MWRKYKLPDAKMELLSVKYLLCKQVKEYEDYSEYEIISNAPLRRTLLQLRRSD